MYLLKMARAGQCTYNYPDVSTRANAIACKLLEDLKVYPFVLWMDNFYRRRFCPTPHSSDKSLNTTVFAVCSVPIRLDPFPGYSSLSSIVGRIDTTTTASYTTQQEHHTLFVNTYNAIIAMNRVRCPLDIRRCRVVSSQWCPLLMSDEVTGSNTGLLQLLSMVLDL